MSKPRAAIVTASLLALAGCAADPEVSQAPVASQPLQLGAGDSLGQSLTRTDRAIAGADARDRALASHPED